MKWANKLGLQGIKLDEYRSEKRDEGTDYHLAIQTYLKYGIRPDDSDFADKLELFFKDKVVIDSERVIENEYFIGRYDVKFMYRDFTFIGDFKSNQKAVYLENKLQLAAYAMVEKCNTCIIHLPNFFFHPITLEQDLYNDFLISLRKIYDLKSRLNEF